MTNNDENTKKGFFKKNVKRALKLAKKSGSAVGQGIVVSGSAVGQGIVKTGSAVGQGIVDTGSAVGQGIVDTAKSGVGAVYNKAKSVGRKAVNATTGISLAKRLRKKLNIVLDATDADYVHEVKITGIVVGDKAYNLVGKFTLNDTLGAAKELSTLIKNGATSKNADKTVPDDNILKEFLTKSNNLLVSIVKKQ